MADTDWTRIAIEVAGWAGSSLVGLVLGAWRGGRRSARQEQGVKDDYNRKIDDLREQMRTSMTQYEKQATARNELLVEQFKESFDGIRRQIDQAKLDTEKDFLRKEDFSDFRKEYREDVRNIFDKLDRIPRAKQ